MLGGAFNPPHVGHLVCAQEARAQLGLDRVVLLPTGVAPHKEIEDDPGGPVRVALARLATGGEPWLSVDPREVRRPGPSFTVATLREIDADAPEDDLTFILGGDQARSFASWREPAEVASLARLGVAQRDGVAREDLADTLAAAGAPADRIAFFAMPRLDISSTDVRRRVREGRPVRHLVPDAVAEAIAAQGLYRGAVPA